MGIGGSQLGLFGQCCIWVPAKCDVELGQVFIWGLAVFLWGCARVAVFGLVPAAFPPLLALFD